MDARTMGADGCRGEALDEGVGERGGLNMSTATSDSGGGRTIFGSSPAAAYIGPVVVFGVLTALEDYLPPAAYPAAYVCKAIAVTAALILARRVRVEIRPSIRVVVPAVATGLAVFVAWLAIERIPYPHIGTR